MCIVYVLCCRHDVQIDFCFNQSYISYEIAFTYYILDVFQYKQKKHAYAQKVQLKIYRVISDARLIIEKCR